MTLSELSYEIRGAAFLVHSTLGPGMFESIYEQTLTYELEKKGLAVKSQVALPLIYETKLFEAGFRIDLLVNNEVIVEVKSVDNLAEVHFRQLTSYLKLADKRLGFLINFNSVSLIDRVSMFRIVNKI